MNWSVRTLDVLRSGVCFFLAGLGIITTVGAFRIPLALAQAPGPSTASFAVDAFQTDLFTGAAASEIAILVPPGAAGTAPKIVLRYNSTTVDDLAPRDQGQGTGLGWTLDIGGFVVRDTKGTTGTGDDTFKLLFGGVGHDLVLIDSAQNLYHTRDDTFVRLQYTASADYWTLWTKDGTRHRLGFNSDSKAIALGPDFVTPVTYKYLLDEVTTTSGVSVRYTYAKQTATAVGTGRSYDQAIYPDLITWSYQSGGLIGPAREVRFLRAPRSDWTDTSASTGISFFERDRLDAIEVRVGGDLVRRYRLTSDYSSDRDTSYNWGGGAAGDLTLRSVTMHGTDGTSALPSVTFSYTNARLSSVSNGIGGIVAYGYERVATSAAIYRHQLYSRGNQECYDAWVLSHSPVNNAGCAVTLLGYLMGSGVSGTSAAIYRHQLYSRANQECYDAWELSNSPVNNAGCAVMFLGYLMGSGVSGTSAAIYRHQLYSRGNQECYDAWVLSDSPVNNAGCAVTLLGYLYIGPFERYRVVARNASDGRGNASTMTFSYNGFALSSDSKEFRGHAVVRAIDAAGAYTDTWFHQSDAQKGRPYQSETRSSSGALYVRVVNTWATTNPYPGVTAVALSRSDVYACDGGATCRQTAQSFEYDGYGNPTRTYNWGDVALAGDERDERTSWLIDGTNWLHRPSRTATHDGAGNLVREGWLSYDGLAWTHLGARGILTREESRLAGPQGNAGNPVITRSYDGYGNRTSTTDPRGCATSITYDTSRTYPASVTTCFGHMTSFTYDARWGAKLSETDPNGQTTTHAYDTFGRLTRITGPLDTASLYGSVSHFYLDVGSAGQRIVTYRTEEHGTAKVISSEQHFDGLGRVYHARADGPDGQMIHSEPTFDARGLVAARSAPHFSTEAAVWTLLSYDPLGRQRQVLNPDGTTVTSIHTPGLLTVTDERGNVKRRFSDAYGRLTRVEEVNGAETYVTTYAYDATGALVRSTNHLGHVTTMTYDFLGRKIAMQDPNMGSWSYSYDLAGNMVSQTDAKNQTLTFTYDLQGRILTKRYPSGAQVQWTYDDPAVAYSKGRLTRMTDPETVTSFSYDRLGRVTQTSRLLDGTTYTMSQNYDALGRLTSQTFPDEETITYTFNEAGSLKSAPGYVTNISYNARGQRTQMQYANGTASTWTYDPESFRLTNQSTSGPGGAGLQNLSYAHDPVGNITQITDAIYTGSRTLSYDALNRLTSASGAFGPNLTTVTQSYRYNAIGNIVEKGGVLYSYSDTLHPAAVTGRSDGISYSYDANGNMVTGAGRAMTWDEDNRLAAVTIQGGNSATFAYDYTGQRVRKTTSAGVTRYPFPNYEIGTNGVVIKRLGFAAKKSTGEALFYHSDHLGGVNVITDASGAKVQLVEYDPWGTVSREEGTADPSIRFTGQWLDPETDLMYYGGRYYDQTLGRFISADPFVPTPSDPQALNRYSYVLNDPVNATDPDGHFFKSIKKAFKFVVKFHSPEFQLKHVAPTAAPIAAGIVVGGAVTLATGNPALGGMAGGMAAGAVGTAINGGDLATNIVVGAAFGAIGGAIVPGLGGVIAQATGSAFVGTVAAAAIYGAATGALSAAIFGGDVGQGAMWGAVTGAALAAAFYAAYELGEPAEPGTFDSLESPDESRGAHEVLLAAHDEVGYDAGPSRATKTGKPNSIYEQVGPDGRVRSRSFYDSDGCRFCRQDFDHSHHKIQGPHEHNYRITPRGPDKESVIKLPPGYSNRPSGGRGGAPLGFGGFGGAGYRGKSPF